MSWQIHIKKEWEDKQKEFCDIVENFNNLGEIIFKERNTLKKIQSKNIGLLAVKSFKIPHLLNQYVYNGIRKSKAYRSFHYAEILIKSGIHTPNPLAYFEERKHGKLKQSFYISEYYPYDFTFRELIEKKEDFKDWNSILESFSQFIYTVHQARILFKDLSPGNVLIKRVGESYQFSLIDLNRMKFKKLSLDERIQNFIKLSLTDEMIPIISKKYADLIHKEPVEIERVLFLKNKKYINKKKRKQKIKKMIGKK